MNAVVSRVQTPGLPGRARPSIQIEIVKLARGCGLSPWQMKRRLIESACPLRQKGQGTKRRHVFVTLGDVQAFAPWIFDAINDWNILLGIKRPRAEDDDHEG